MSTDQRIRRTLLSLAGLSLGDALGEQFFGPPLGVLARIESRTLPRGPYPYTDDTMMAISIVEVLLECGKLDPDRLAARFAQCYMQQPRRGYGAAMHDLLPAFHRGVSWRDAAPALFGGSGSFGNGAAMRVAPLGAYFAGDMDAVVENAKRSAAVTHAHQEGIAGAVAIAVAAAAAVDLDMSPLPEKISVVDDERPRHLFESVLRYTPAGETRDGIERAVQIPAGTHSGLVAERLGSGQRVSAQDTVPFVIWCAAHHLSSFEEAFWATLAGLGDRDTTCAMVGGIVALSSGCLPARWLEAREPLADHLTTVMET